VCSMQSQCKETSSDAVRMLPACDWVAGSHTHFEIEYTAGPQGIAPGGAVTVIFHHALLSLDSDWQTTEPDREGYIRVAAHEDDNLAVEWFNWRPESMEIARGASGHCRHGVIARILQTPIEPGGKIRFLFGTPANGVRIPIYTCEDNEIRVLADPDGSTPFECVGTACNSILAGPVHHLFVTAPATLAAGGKADVHVRAEDEYHNVASDCEVSVNISGAPGVPDVTAKLNEGIARVDIPLAEPGVYRFTAESESDEGGSHLSARSNPVVVTDKAPEYHVYWGDIHGHTQHSDGLGTDADYYLAYGRDAADLDVCGTADHAYREPAREASARFNEPGRFVTIWGWEWAAREPGRLDRNIYCFSEDEENFKGWPATTEGFWQALEEAYGDNHDRRVMVGPHMFTYKSACPAWHESWDERYERFIEIYSEHGMSEYYGNPRMLHSATEEETHFFAVEGLKRGIRCGFIGSSDNHDSHPGRGAGLRYPGGIVAFLAKDLTRESIWDALWNRRVYAATTERIFIDFRIDGHVMGEEFKTQAKPKISYTVYGCDDNFDAFLIKNGDVMKKTRTSNGEVREEFTDDAFEGSSFYYLRIVQDDGEWAWSSPIWVDAD